MFLSGTYKVIKQACKNGRIISLACVNRGGWRDVWCVVNGADIGGGLMASVIEHEFDNRENAELDFERMTS